jgi:hypothetical protein
VFDLSVSINQILTLPKIEPCPSKTSLTVFNILLAVINSNTNLIPSFSADRPSIGFCNDLPIRILSVFKYASLPEDDA